MIPAILAFLGLGFLIGQKKASASPVADPSYPVSIWRALIKKLAPASLDVEFVLKWIEVESNGNPCAVGSFKSFGPDGNPLEMGIGQFYNPDDLVRLKLTGSELRAYCIPGTQRASRVLTPTEMTRQAQAMIDLIKSCQASATNDLRSVGATWSPRGRDFYKLTKLQHGLPGLPRMGMPAVTKKLGHAPRDWQEFRTTLASVKLDSNTEKYRDGFAKILNNAEKTAAVVQERGEI